MFTNLCAVNFRSWNVSNRCIPAQTEMRVPPSQQFFLCWKVPDNSQEVGSDEHYRHAVPHDPRASNKKIKKIVEKVFSRSWPNFPGMMMICMQQKWNKENEHHIETKKKISNNVKISGSGCGAVVRAVASDTRGHGFESSHWQLLLNIYLLVIVCRKDENKRKRGWEWPI